MADDFRRHIRSWFPSARPVNSDRVNTAPDSLRLQPMATPPTASLCRRELLLLFAILVCAIGIRLIAISQPYVDAWSWRQADVAMIAENFYRHDFALFYPQINWAGNAPGYVGTEFPLVAWI